MANTILITTSSFGMDSAEIKALEAAGFTPRLNPYGRRLTEDEVSSLLTEDVVGMVAGVEPLTQAVISNSSSLKVISRCGAGMDSVDLNAAQQAGITVCNTPAAPAPAVAELTIGLMLDVLRGISFQDRTLRRHEWDRPQGGLLGARTIGLIGYGHIGKLVATIASSFGAKIIAHDPFAKPSPEDIATLVDFDTLITQADIISLHTPYLPELHHIINADVLAQMKPGAILINAARGGLVDEAALHQALTSGHIGGAGLDVFEDEPYTGPLTALDQVVLTAHVGSYAKETRVMQEAEAVMNLMQALGLKAPV